MGAFFGGTAQSASALPPEERLKMLRAQLVELDKKNVNPRSAEYIGVTRSLMQAEAELEQSRQSGRR